ncbi:winged helix-turn-helix domain-containing protein [Subdoligranulum variabile]|uniref:Transcriptional regulatory protein, C-terminal domain protein n=1 Tax=Subdoligranulum variabile DSM 15176 TaxID=411471 RepID=D1PRQ3_9FIRM|nr:winged helix-turn-helix domain-containing protein [Subdoligranulum variabile]EFB74594.1 transcriptional regulatory protein, C-terminal domain protein [Subdoligranulum variabile DSM 15176]UWP69657.1 winged helix-turn-helix domain-containing protein [Subdoligranulum variabile]
MSNAIALQETFVTESKPRTYPLLRRASRKLTEFRFKDLFIDLRAHRVFRQEEEVALTPREYALLETLVRNRNIALTRSQLLTDAWGYDYIGESRTVDVHINRVRRKLGLEQEIQTVFKVGYRLNTRGLL